MTPILNNNISQRAGLRSLARALLYEVYSTYSFDAAEIRAPILYGTVFPEDLVRQNSHIRSSVQTECLLKTKLATVLDIEIRFLHSSGGRMVERQFQWGQPLVPVESEKEEHVPGVWTYTRIIPVPGRPGIFSVTVRLDNRIPLTDPRISGKEALTASFLAAHMIVCAPGGEFVSAQNPEPDLRLLAQACANHGLWPVLADPADSIVLAAPVILCDHPPCPS